MPSINTVPGSVPPGTTAPDASLTTQPSAGKTEVDKTIRFSDPQPQEAVSGNIIENEVAEQKAAAQKEAVQAEAVDKQHEEHRETRHAPFIHRAIFRPK